MRKEKLLELLNSYVPFDDIEKGFKEQTIDFLKQNELFLGKGNTDGHITASAWILNNDKTKTLLTLHKKYDIWVQLGGHTENDEEVSVGAFREAKEESGLSSVKFLSDKIFDISVHIIPDRKNEKEHLHYDIRFAFEADENEKIVVSDESKDVRWVEIDKIEDYTKEDGIKRMVDKTYKYLIIN